MPEQQDLELRRLKSKEHENLISSRPSIPPALHHGVSLLAAAGIAVNLGQWGVCGKKRPECAGHAWGTRNDWERRSWSHQAPWKYMPISVGKHGQECTLLLAICRSFGQSYKLGSKLCFCSLADNAVPCAQRRASPVRRYSRKIPQSSDAAAWGARRWQIHSVVVGSAGVVLFWQHQDEARRSQTSRRPPPVRGSQESFWGSKLRPRPGAGVGGACATFKAWEERFCAEQRNFLWRLACIEWWIPIMASRENWDIRYAMRRACVNAWHLDIAARP